MRLADVGGGARHPQRAVLHLLAQADEEGAVVFEFEAAAGQLSDQRRLLEAALEGREDTRQLAQDVRNVGGGHQTASSIMKPTRARPLSGTTQSTFWPRCRRPLFRNSS